MTDGLIFYLYHVQSVTLMFYPALEQLKLDPAVYQTFPLSRDSSHNLMYLARIVGISSEIKSTNLIISYPVDTPIVNTITFMCIIRNRATTAGLG